jgi:hypothetical protein
LELKLQKDDKTTMDVIEDAYKKVMLLIKLIALNPKSIDLLIDTSIKRLNILGRKNLNFDKKHLKAVFTSPDFLQQFVGAFCKIFSENEISNLIEIYQSNVMQKMHENSAELFEPLYKAINEHIDKL